MRKGILMTALLALVAFGFTGMNAVQAEGVVAGAVIDQEGAPIEGAHVVLVAAIRERGERPFHVRSESAENGGFLFEEVPAGAYFISAGIRDVGHAREEIEVADDQVTEVQLQLEVFDNGDDEEMEFGSVSGVVINADGEPVARAIVTIMPNRREMRGMRGMRGIHRRLTALTDRNGEFAIDQVPAGDHGIMAGAFRLGMVRGEVSVEADQNTEIELQLAEGDGGRGGGGRGGHGGGRGGGGGIIENNRNQGVRSFR